MANQLKTDWNIERMLRKHVRGYKLAKLRAQAREAINALNADALDKLADDAEIEAEQGALAFGLREVAAKVREKQDRNQRRLAQNAELIAAIKNGCPYCGSPMKRNSSLTGWWQCGQYGAVGFRMDSSKPSCGYQGFIVEESVS